VKTKRKNEETGLVQLRSYPAPWQGELVLVCTKCTKKLKRRKDGGLNVRKWLKKRSKKSGNGLELRVIGVNCVKMCPKDGITIATQKQLGREPAEVSIVYSEGDLEALYAQLSASPTDDAAY
jgi:predicted metal-binding protein